MTGLCLSRNSDELGLFVQEKRPQQRLPFSDLGRPTFSERTGALSAELRIPTATLGGQWVMPRFAGAAKHDSLVRLFAAWMKSGLPRRTTPFPANWFSATLPFQKDSWEAARSRIEQLTCLREGWDSYGAEQISHKTITNAQEVVDVLEALGIEPRLPEVTSESSIIVTGTFGGTQVTIEIDDADEVGAAVRRDQDTRTRYADPELNYLSEFLRDELNGVR